MIDMMVNLLYSLSPFVLLVTISHSVKKGEKNLSLYLASRSHDMKTIPSRIPTPSSCQISAHHRAAASLAPVRHALLAQLLFQGLHRLSAKLCQIRIRRGRRG